MNTGRNTDIEKNGNEYVINAKQLRKLIYLGCFLIYNSQLVHNFLKIGRLSGLNVQDIKGGKMMKVLAKSDSGSVVQEILVDKTKLNASGAAYGASSNSMATRNLSSLEQAGSMVNTNHMELKNSKNEGYILPLAVKIYLMTGGKTIYASRKDVSRETGEEKMKVFLKEHKVRWKDPQSLLQVVDFIAQETTEE